MADDNLPDWLNPLDDISGGKWLGGPRGSGIYQAPVSTPGAGTLPPGQRPTLDPDEMMENRGIQLPRNEENEQLAIDPNVRDPLHDPRIPPFYQGQNQQQVGWKAQLDDLMGQTVQDTDQQNQNQGVTWRKMLDQLATNPVDVFQNVGMRPPMDYKQNRFMTEPLPKRPDSERVFGTYQEDRYADEGEPLGAGRNRLYPPLPTFSNEDKSQLADTPRFDMNLPPSQDPVYRGGPRPLWAPPTTERAAGQPHSWLDNFNFIGTAQARGARPPSTHPAQGPEPPGSPPIGTRQQQPDGTFKTYVGGGQWMEGEYTPPEKPKTGGEKHTITPSEYSLKLWEEAQRHKTGQQKEQAPPWFDEQGDINWDRAFDPKYGIFPLNAPAIYRQIHKENLGRMQQGFEQIDKALKGEEPNTSAFERWGALLGGGLGFGTGYQAVEAVARSVLGQPLENVTKFPREYTEFAIANLIPGFGLLRTPAMAARPLARSQYRTLQKEASIDPLNVTPTSPAGSPGWLSQQQEFQQYVEGMKQKPQVPGYRPEGQLQKAAQWFEQTFSPETAGATAQDASAVMREWLGMGEREAAQAYDMMNRGTLWGEGASFYKQVERSGEAPAQSAYKHIPGWNSKDELAAYLDGSPKAVKPDPDSSMGVIAYKVRQAIEKTTEEWKKNLSPEQQEMVRDKYLKHKWKNWAESGTGQAAEAGRGGPLSGAKMAKRSPFAKDYAMGRENGLIPAYDNPLDGAMNSIVEMRRDITQHNVMQSGQEAGTVRAAEGANADALKKNGYVALAGQHGQYAPENWARIYNNFYDSGFQGGAKSFLDTARHFTNANTQFLLGLSMYHAFTMGEATMGTQLARVFANTMPQIKEEGWWGAGKSFLDALEVPFAPLTYYGRGMKAQTAYLNEMAHPEAQRAISYLSRANWRPMPTSAFTPDVAISGATEKFGTFADSARHGTFLRDLQAGGFVSNVGRIMDSINTPLFKTYIPRVKAGVNLRRMQDVLEREPGLSETEYLDRARRIVDSTDNRFGEMVQDNIFWNRGLKQSLMLGMLSYSWTMGGAREWGGGGRDIARFLTGQAMMTPKAQYVVASSMIWGLMNTMAMKLHTGSYPWEEPTLTDPDGKQHKTEMWQGLMGYYTGGWVERKIPPNPDQWGKPFAKFERVWEPEQGRVPGYMKDIIGFLHHPLVESEGKIGSGPRNVQELGITGKDYFGRPIYEPRSKVNLMDQIPRWAKNAWDHMVDQSFPITLQNLGFGGKRLNPMTGLNTPEVIMGMQPAQSVLANPYRELTGQYFDTLEWRKKQAIEAAGKKREQELRLRRDKEYGGPQ